MGHLAEQDGQPGGQAVEHHVEGGQGQDVAGEHGAEHGEGVEEQAQQEDTTSQVNRLENTTAPQAASAAKARRNTARLGRMRKPSPAR